MPTSDTTMIDPESVTYTSIPAPMEYLIEGRKIMLSQSDPANLAASDLLRNRAFDQSGVSRATVAAVIHHHYDPVIRELVDALRPFAQLADRWQGKPPTDMPIGLLPQGASPTATVADILHARAVLAKCANV